MTTATPEIDDANTLEYLTSWLNEAGKELPDQVIRAAGGRDTYNRLLETDLNGWKGGNDSMSLSTWHQETSGTSGARRIRPVDKSSDSSESKSSMSISPPGSASAAEELRREKNRQKVRRHYYRKLNQLNALRAQAAHLEETYKRLQQEEPLSGMSLSLSTKTHCEQRVETSRPDREVLEQLLRVRRALEEENNLMRQTIVMHKTYEQNISSLLRAEHELFLQNPRFFMIAKPLTRQECETIRMQAWNDVVALSSTSILASADGMVLGWRDARGVEDGFFKFMLQKTIEHRTVPEVEEWTWPILSDPSNLAKLYSSSVQMRCHVVQQVDADNVVLFQEYRTMDRNNEHVVMKSLFLISRFQTATGSLIILRGLDRSRLQHEDLWIPPAHDQQSVVWHDIFSWLQMDTAGAAQEHCVCKFAGTAPTVGANATFWTIEVLLLALRWESCVLGPRFQLLNSNAEDPQRIARLSVLAVK